MINKLLSKQVQKHLGDPAKLPEDVAAFIKMVSGTYDGFEDKIKSLEGSVDACANELCELHEKLLNETRGLKDAHNELSRIFNQVNEGFFSKDIITDRYIQMSVGCEKIYGYSIDDFYANSLLWFEVIHPDDRCLIDKENDLLSKGMQTIRAYRITHKDQTTRWIEVKAIPVIVEGRLTKVEGVVNDITERKNAEKLLIDSEVKYRSFFEHSIDGILLSKLNGAILEANPAACEIFRATEKEICSYSNAELMNFTDPALTGMIEERSRTGKYKGELNLRRGDSTKFMAEIDSSIFRDAYGEDRSCIIVRDITDRKNAENIIKDSEERIKLIMDAALDAIICIDRSDIITFWNPRAEKIFGWNEEEVKGSMLSNLIIPLAFREMHRKGIQKYLQTGHGPALNVILELSAVNRQGQEFPIELTVLPIKQGEEEFFCAFIRDITERKKSEKQIKDSERRYRTLFELNLAGIYQTTISGQILTCNHAFAAMLGYASPQELMQINAQELHYSKEDRDCFISNLREQKKLYNYEGVLKCRNGNPLHIIENISLSKDPLSGEEIYDGIMIDITEKRLTEKNTRESIERFQRLSQATHDAIWDWNLLTDEVWWNEGFYKLFGYDKDLPVPDLYEWTKKIHPDDSNKVISRLKQIRKNTVDYWEDEFRYEINGNNYGTVLDRAYVLRDDTGKPIRVIGAIMDITERKKTEQQIAHNERRYRQIVETAQEGIWMIDENNNTTFINKKMCEIIEYLPEEITGKGIHSFMDETANKNALAQIERRKQGINETHDSTFITKSGKAVSTSLSTNGIFDNEGIYRGALAMVTDITKRKQDEELLKKSEAILDLKNKELKRKNRELEEFAYVVSHDLQEPLRTTTSFVELLKQQYAGKLDPKADKYLHFIVDSSDRMKILINDLLDYSRIGGKNEMERVDCNKILMDVTADLYKAISDSAAEIVSGDLPIIMGYPTEIKQLFQNLVINAIKFSKANVAPQIKISVERTGDFWDFAIADNGIGIDNVHSEKIFVIFQRLHTRSEYPGSGIGLSHCKKIVELHHGKIWVESVPGEGSIFHFTILESDSI